MAPFSTVSLASKTMQCAVKPTYGQIQEFTKVKISSRFNHVFHMLKCDLKSNFCAAMKRVLFCCEASLRCLFNWMPNMVAHFLQRCSSNLEMLFPAASNACTFMGFSCSFHKFLFLAHFASKPLTARTVDDTWDPFSDTIIFAPGSSRHLHLHWQVTISTPSALQALLKSIF